MSWQRLPKSRALRVLVLLAAGVAFVLLVLFVFVGVACNNETGFSCGG